MATTITGRTTQRWTLDLPDTSDQSVAAWLAQHVDVDLVTVPQVIACDDAQLTILLDIPQGAPLGTIPVEATPTLVADPPVPVVCVHRWMPDPDRNDRRSCMECQQPQIMGWVDAT